ncbi:MAG TPA: hypothetical protein GX714_02385 [Chloroflexi bacterium]|jgi:hypothetical protein|nr:hypothetical protein [Chloroflexota bacterium]
MTLRLHFSPSDWDRIARDYGAWWAHELDRPLVQITEKVPDPELPAEHTFASNYPWSWSAEEVIAAVTPHLEAMRYYGDAFPRWWPNLGPGVMAAFLGARALSVPETVWFEPDVLREVHDIQFCYQPEGAWWRRAAELTKAAVDAWGDMVQVGHTDLGGNLDILASFRTTQNLLIDLYDAPEEVARLVDEVTRLWLRYYDELNAIIAPTCPGSNCWAPIWSSGTTYMLQCDFSYMISPAMFERFAVPDLVACCHHLDHAFYHLDGRGQIAHLDMLLSIERLRGIQWVPGDGAPPPDQWLDVLRRVIDAGKLCQVFVTAEGARHIVRNIGGKGFLLAVSTDMTAEEAGAFLQLLAREDISR